MTYLNTLKSQKIDPILVDGGDWLFSIGTVKNNKHAERQLLDKGRLLVDAYNEFGYNAAAIAEHDLIFGIEVLREYEKRAKFPFLCANLLGADSKPLFPGSTVVVRNGLRIGIVAAVMQLSERFLEGIDPTLKVGDPIEAIRREVDALGDSVDVVFLLGHLHRKDVDAIADSMPGIDFILEPSSFQGNESTWIQPHEEFTLRNGRLLLKVSGQGAQVGKLDLYFRGRGKPWVSLADDSSSAENLYWAETTRLAPHIGRHPGIQKLVDAFLKGTRYRGLTEEDLTFVPSEEFLTAETCGACHVEQTEFWRGTGHGTAYSTLEKTGDQFRYDCVSCHVLAYGETFVDAHEPGRYKDVQCESCHGTNPKHPEDPAAHPWDKVNPQGCWSCHNPQVTRVPFDPTTAFPKVTCPPLKRD